MANVNFFSPDGGTTRYPIEDTEARSRIAGQQNQLNAQGVLGAKNLFKVTAESQTRDGITFTVNKDSGGNVLNVTANGTSADGRTTLGRVELDVGTYKLNGSPKSPNLYDWRFRLFDPSTDFVIAWDDGEGATFTVSTKKTYELQIRYEANVVFNNIVFKPMIRLASDPDDTYQPYVMTNRELTEKVFEKRTLTSADDLNNVKTTGVYGITTAPTNSPENQTYGTLIVQATSTGDLRQMFWRVGGGSGLLYIRSFGGIQGSWTPWYKFTGTVVS